MVGMKAVALTLVGLAMTGCVMNFGGGTPGSGKLVTVDRKVDGFTKVANETGGDVSIEVGKPFSVKVTIDDNLEKMVTTKVVDGELEISSSERIDPTMLRVEITMPSIEAMAIEGAGDAMIEGVDSPAMTASIEGAGDIVLKGKTKDLGLSIEGAGNIDAFGLNADKVKASIAGAGSINLAASQTLDATIEGAGDIRYHGDPKVTKSIDGAGSIEKG